MIKIIKIIFIVVNLLFFIITITIKPEIFSFPILQSSGIKIKMNYQKLLGANLTYWDKYFSQNSIQIESPGELPELVNHLFNSKKIIVTALSDPVFVTGVEHQQFRFGLYRVGVSMQGEYSDALYAVYSVLNKNYIRLGDYFEIFPPRRGSNVVTITGNFYIITQIPK